MSSGPPAAFLDEDGPTLVLEGNWQQADLPDIANLLGRVGADTEVSLRVSDLSSLDSRLTAQLLHVQRQLLSRGCRLRINSQNSAVENLLKLSLSVERHEPPAESRGRWLSIASLRSAIADVGDSFLDSMAFLGATVRALGRTLMGRSAMRPRELLLACYQTGPDALPIITLTSILVGMILAYLGAAQLQQFGAAVYVADLVAIGMLREMGALMTAVVMAGRTGAAYAAQLSTMQGNEEIDAISTLGIDPLEFLVVPRIIALIVMMPLLVVFADLLGILGGALVAGGMGVTPLQYLSQLQGAVSASHFIVGITKALLFALLIALAGCWAGMNAGRNSAAVGQATTEAVVTAVVYLIVADAAINILCQQLGY